MEVKKKDDIEALPPCERQCSKRKIIAADDVAPQKIATLKTSRIGALEQLVALGTLENSFNSLGNFFLKSKDGVETHGTYSLKVENVDYEAKGAIQKSLSLGRVRKLTIIKFGGEDPVCGYVYLDCDNWNGKGAMEINLSKWMVEIDPHHMEMQSVILATAFEYSRRVFLANLMNVSGLDAYSERNFPKLVLRNGLCDDRVKRIPVDFTVSGWERRKQLNAHFKSTIFYNKSFKLWDLPIDPEGSYRTLLSESESEHCIVFKMQ